MNKKSLVSLFFFVFFVMMGLKLRECNAVELLCFADTGNYLVESALQF